MTLLLTNDVVWWQHPDKVALNEEFEMIIKFNNPLDEKLTHGKFHIEGHGVTKCNTIVLK